METPTNGYRRQEFWETLSQRRVTECTNKWQLFWDFGKFKGYSYIYSDQPYHIRVKLHLKNPKISLISFFENFTFDIGKNKFSVGNLIISEQDNSGGNGWDAPFENRNFVKIQKSNCYRFLYKSTSECEANNVQSYEDQIDEFNTTLTLGFYWPMEDIQYNQSIIYRITLWIKKP